MGMACESSGETVANVTVRTGYYKFSAASPYVYRCANTDVEGEVEGATNCLGGTGDASCKEGSTG